MMATLVKILVKTLDPYQANVPFLYPPGNVSKPTFSGGIEIEHWPGMC